MDCKENEGKDQKKIRKKYGQHKEMIVLTYLVSTPGRQIANYQQNIKKIGTLPDSYDYLKVIF